MASNKIPRERAERVRAVLVATFFVQSMVVTAIIVRIPEIIENLGLSNNLALWGSITGFSGIGSILSLLFASKIIERLGTSRVVLFGTLASTVIAGLLPIINNYVVYFFLILSSAFIFSLFNNAANEQALMVQHRLKRVIIGGVHGAWSLGVGVTSLVSGLLAAYVPLAIHIGVLAAIGFCIHLALNTQLMNREEQRLSKPTQKLEAKVSWLKTPKFVWLISLGMFVGVWPELVMGDWMPLYSRTILDLEPVQLAVPFAAFSGAMIIGRFGTGWISERIHVNKAASIGGYLGAFAMTLGLVSGLTLINYNVWLAIIVESVFFFIAGLGESIQVPAFYSAVSHIREIPSSQALARMNLASSPMVISAKALMGLLASTVGLVWAMVFPIAAFLASGLVQRMVGKRARFREAQNLTAFPPTGTIPVQVMKD